MHWIVDPSDPDCTAEAVTGGKGAALARLHALGICVPAFKVISTAAYREMGHAAPCGALLAELRETLEALNKGGGIAVRSSAIGEDSDDGSFAGLYHTSLDVRDFDGLVSAINACWASYRGAAATSYREQHGGEQGGAMAVVLQEMVHAEWAGVCYTAHPVDLALCEGLINAIPGLGEALVSGTVNPEEITVSVADGCVLKRVGGQGKPLPEGAIAAVWCISKNIAEQLHFPQDIEWAWRAGALYILQSRPITTIADVFYSRALEPWRNDREANPDLPSRIWSRMLADETWVSPISPLFYNIHNSTPGRVGFLRSHGDRSKLPPDMFKYHGATAYVDVTVIRRMYEYQPPIARIRGILNFFPADMQHGIRHGSFRWRGRLRRMLSYELHNRQMRSLFNNHRYVQAQWPAYVEKSNRWLGMDLDNLPLETLRAHQVAVQREMAAVGPPCANAVLSHASDLHLLLTGLLERWCARPGSNGESLYARISSGLEGSEALQENETLWAIAERVRNLGPELATCACCSDWEAFRARLSSHADGPGIIASFEAFWHAHRHLGSSYKDLIWPRWGDDIELCFTMVKGYIDSSAIRPSLVHARSAQARCEAQQEILAGLGGALAPLRRCILRWLFRYNEIYMAIRDNHRFYVDRNWYEVRRIYRSYGARLVTAAVLEDRDEIFFLGTSEVEDALAGALKAGEATRRIGVRRRVWQATLRRQGPKFLRGWAAFEDSSQHAGSASEQHLQGIAASPGSAIGKARIVYDVSGLCAVKDGEILVTRQTDPSWTTVFGRISGLVLETGGVLSHGTSLCREYGLPCVTAVERATVRSPDGCTIELQGNAGTVRILEAA